MGGISPIGLDALTWLLRNQRGRHHQTRHPSVGQRAIQARAARAGLVGDDESSGTTVQPSQELVEVGFPGADLAHIDNIGRAVGAGVGDGDGRFVDV